jgi:hypothetical protein
MALHFHDNDTPVRATFAVEIFIVDTKRAMVSSGNVWVNPVRFGHMHGR